MISRTSQLPRICLACRFGLAPRAALPNRSRPSYASDRRPRYASDFSPQNKERIEALISGALDDIESDSNKKHGSGHRGNRGGKYRRPASPDELAEWELEPEERKPLAANAESNPAIISEETLDSDEALEMTPEAQGRRSSRRIFRHDLLNHQSLGVDALGKPVEALIIKNPNKMRNSKRQIPILEEEMASTGIPLEWKSVLPTDDTPESEVSNEVMQNIDEIRPTNTTYLKRKDFDKLIDSLVDGFTRGQLVTYANRGKWDGAFDEDNSPSYSWVKNQSPWVAAQSNHWELLKPKQQQAVLIMSGLWKLEVQEQIEGLGRGVVWVQPDIFELIARPSNGVLDALRNDFLDKSNNERISVNSEECRLSIYAPKATVSTVLSRLDEAVQSIRSRTISTDHIPTDNLTLPVLADLGKITKTAIRQGTSPTDLLVSWLAEDDISNGQTEDPAHVVLRLLLGRPKCTQQHDMHLISRSKGDKVKDGTLIPYLSEKRSMSWRDRLRPWSRFVNPVTKIPSERNESLSDLAEKLAKKPLLLKPDSDVMGSSVETIATFGHILHTQADARESKMASSRRILAPIVPHPAALTPMTADIQSPTTQTTVIILNFIPSALEPSETHPSGTHLAPNVELRLPIDPFSDLSNFPFLDESVLEAIVPKRTSDFVLPDESVDVRLTQKQRTSLNASQETLREFLRGSEFNLLEGRLRTPSGVKLSVPAAFLFSKSDRTAEPADTMVQYVFMGLELHQTVSVDWQGHTLQYSTIEAGQHGGQRQELSLIANADHLSSPARSASGTHDLNAYLQLVGKIASGAVLPWDKGHLLMNERSSEEFTMDMMDDSYKTEQPSQDASDEPVDYDSLEALTEEREMAPATEEIASNIHDAEKTELSEERLTDGNEEKKEL